MESDFSKLTKTSTLSTQEALTPQTLSPQSLSSVDLGTYELTLSSANFNESECISFPSFMQKVHPTVMYYADKGLNLGKSAINPESPYSKEELGKRLMSEVYPKLSQINSLDEADRLLKDLYVAYPESKKLVNDIRTTFDPNSGGGGVVFAIPPVVVVGVLVYAAGYAVGYFLS